MSQDFRFVARSHLEEALHQEFLLPLHQRGERSTNIGCGFGTVSIPVFIGVFRFYLDMGWWASIGTALGLAFVFSVLMIMLASSLDGSKIEAARLEFNTSFPIGDPRRAEALRFIASYQSDQDTVTKFKQALGLVDQAPGSDVPAEDQLQAGLGDLAGGGNQPDIFPAPPPLPTPGPEVEPEKPASPRPKTEPTRPPAQPVKLKEKKKNIPLDFSEVDWDRPRKKRKSAGGEPDKNKK